MQGTSGATAPAASGPIGYIPGPSARKFAGEDEEDDEGDDDWDVSDSEKAKPAAGAVNAGPAPAPRKKGTLKAKLAEKAKLAAEGKLGGGDDLIDEETPQERRRRERLMEMEADAANAADLVGGMSVDDADLNSIAKANPTTKAEFEKLAQQISGLLFQRLANKPLYAAFATEICKQAVQPCRDADVRKVGTALGVIANEKQKEAKEAASGKKKTTAKAKPMLGANKALATK